MSSIGTLFFTFLKIGLFSIGGGYAIIPLIHEQVVTKAGWISEKIFTDIITISQMTPGPLAVNTSTFVGLRIGGIGGAVAATVGAVVGGAVISLSLYRFFQKHRNSDYIFEILKGLKSASMGLIISAVVTIMLLAFWGSSTVGMTTMIRETDKFAVAIFAVILFISRKWKVHPVLLMAVSGVAGVFIYV